MSTRTTAELRPGDTIRSAGPTVRTVQANDHPRPESIWHTLRFQDGTSLWSHTEDTWELLPQSLADAWDAGYTAATEDHAQSIRQENPYRD